MAGFPARCGRANDGENRFWQTSIRCAMMNLSRIFHGPNHPSLGWYQVAQASSGAPVAMLRPNQHHRHHQGPPVGEARITCRDQGAHSSLKGWDGAWQDPQR